MSLMVLLLVVIVVVDCSSHRRILSAMHVFRQREREGLHGSSKGHDGRVMADTSMLHGDDEPLIKARV